MKNQLRNYNPGLKEQWTGRIDDLSDPDSYRIHQVIQTIDLREFSISNPDNTLHNLCLLGFMCDAGVVRNLGRPGAAKGPAAIRKELANLPVTFGNSVEIYDAGDIFCIDDNLEEAQYELSKAIEIILANNLFPVILGGGHETALGNYNGLTNYLKGSGDRSYPAIINFDAHLDFRPYQNGGSSGSMFYQIADQCTQNEIPFSYMCIGAQTYGNTKSLFQRAESFGAEVMLAKNITKDSLQENIEQIETHIKDEKHIYITVCSDVFNAAIAPGVSAPQPFGLDPELVLQMIKKIFKTGKVLCFDLCEVSPRFDNDNITAKLAAVIVFAVINVLNEAQ